MYTGADLERLVEIRIIQEDTESIYSLLTTERDPIFALGIIPYYALFIKSCQEYLGKDFLPDDISLKIKDIRNHIKQYADRFGKTQKSISIVDSQQDELYRAKNPVLRKLDRHKNLGTYWTEDYHLIGNTQQLADFLNVEDPFSEEAKKKQKEFGYQIGSFVSSFRTGLAKRMAIPTIVRVEDSVEIKYYYDLNTNHPDILFNKNITKETNLFFLDLLSNLNFVKYILSPLFSNQNIWLFRIKYVVIYYTCRALERYKNSILGDEQDYDLIHITKALDEGNNLFKPKFRGCMMHYRIEGEGLISRSNIEDPFYGIVETCFGTDFQSYLDNLNVLSDEMIQYLESKFDYSDIDLHELKK